MEHSRSVPRRRTLLVALLTVAAALPVARAGADVQPFGSAAPNVPEGDVVALAPSGSGVLGLRPDGSVGTSSAPRLNGSPVGLAATPTGAGHWVAASDGGVFTAGDARFFGSAGNLRLQAPVVAIAATPTGRGYWLAAADGGVFTYGDARFFGSAGNLRLQAPVVGMAASPKGGGYWLAASDGGVFTYGDAPFGGSAVGRLPAGDRATAIAAPTTGGYWIGTARRVVRLAFAGDVHGEGPVRAVVDRGENPLSEVAGLLRSADVAAVNLETPAAAPGTPQPKEFVFLAPVALLDRLVVAGVDVVSLANNHALDHGPRALLDTIANARARGLVVVGAGANAAEAYAPAFVRTPGGTVGVVGLSRVVPGGWAATPTSAGVASAYDEAAALDAVRRARAGSDVVLVLVHWGVELAPCPGRDITALAARLHAAGATVVAGAHPHVLQGLVTGPTTVTSYSTGNFVWYHDRPPSSATGIVEVEATADRVLGTTFFPARIGPDGRPRLLAGADADRARADLAALAPGRGRCP